MNDIAREYLPTNGNDNGDHKKAFRILPNDQPDFAPINARDRVIEDKGLHPGARLMFVRILDLLMWLKDQLLGIRLDRKQLQQRYGWSEPTVDRRIADEPIAFGGWPMWRLGDLVDAEYAGQIQRPVSGAPRTLSSSKLSNPGQTSA
ncbi:MAG TPA: hypothetical protein VGY56_11635 [Verrucomicrobiae bacterium]|nr:hypothetical protein [Verrucomicrobiae bacterium]